ncbi:Spy/CpxP family protein refolding chaperone [Flavobacterium sp.]|uniref:Spy/CpxP family protein refolding chaperone n=1 Tax=Flavobacterium sp. TaxID=239 RepID=UPI002FDA6E04
MKKIVCILVFITGFTTIGQELESSTKKGNSQREKLTVEQRVELQTKRLTLDLDLTTKQQTELKKVLVSQAQKREKKQNELKEKRAENKSLSADEKFELQNEMLDNQIAFKAEMKKILTPEQFTKWESKMAQNKEKMKSRPKNQKRENQFRK